MIKIAFFDVDGTLLNYGSGSPSPKTVHALKDLQKNGVMLCIATGRSNAALPKIPQIDLYPSPRRTGACDAACRTSS